MDFVFDLQRFAEIDWNVPLNSRNYYYINYTEELNLNSDNFDERYSENSVAVILTRRPDGLYVNIFNIASSYTDYTGHVYGNIEVVDGINQLILDATVNEETRTVSKGTWKLDATFDSGKVTINSFALAADDLHLDKDTFSGHKDDTTLYYDADGKNITENTDSAAVIVERANTSTKDDYTVTVKSKLSSPLIIDGVRAEVTDTNSTGTVYQVKNGPTFTATDSFTVASDGVFTETGSGITVTSGSVTTSVANAKIDISGAGDDVTVTFDTGTAADGAVITTTGGSITLTESGEATDTVIKRDGSIEGIDGTATISFGSIGKYSVNAATYNFTATDASFIVKGDGIYLTSGAVSISGSGEFGYSSVAVANADGTATSSIYVPLSVATVVVADGKYTLSNLTDGVQIMIDRIIFTYNANNNCLKDRNEKEYKSADGTFTITIVDGQDMPASSLTLDSNTFEGHDVDTLYYNADGTLVDQEGDVAVIVKRKDTSTTDEYTVTVSDKMTLPVTIDGVRATVTDNADKGNEYEVYSNQTKYTTFKAKGSFTVTNTTVSDVKGTLTAMEGTLYTTAGDSNAAYNLTNSTGVSFGGNGSDGNALVTALKTGDETGDTVKVTGLATVTSRDGNAEITGLDAVGEKAVITDGTNSAANGTVTYEVVGTKDNKSVVRKTVGTEVSYWTVTEDTAITDSSCGTAMEAAAIVTADYNATTDFLANGLPLSDAGDYKAATLKVEGTTRTLEVKSAITAGVVATGDTVTVKDGGTTTVYTLADDVTLTASDATFTTTGGTVSDVNGTLTVTAGTLATNGGDNSAAYNLTSGTGVSFGGENGSDGGATVTALDGNGANGDTVHVKGFATVTSKDGNAEITGLTAVGEKAVITDGTNSAENGTVTYEVIGTKGENSVVRKTVGTGVSYWTVTDTTVVTDNSCGTALEDAPIVTENYNATTDFLANGLPLSDAGDYKAATLTVEGTTRTLEVKSAITAGVVATGDTVKVTDAGTTTAYTLADDVTLTASGATFTTTGGTVSDVTGTLTVTEGVLDTTAGDSKAAYNLNHNTAVFFDGDGSDGKAIVTALKNGGEAGDEVQVIGKVSVASRDGDAVFIGLDEMGKKVVIKDNTGSAGNGIVTYEVVCDAASAPTIDKTVVRRTDKDGNTSYYGGVALLTMFTDAGCTDDKSFAAVPINTSNYTKSVDFLYNGIPVAKGTKHADVAATLTVDEKGSKTLQVKSAITEGVETTDDTVAVTDEGTDTVYTLADGVTVTAKSATFTTTSGTVSDVNGPLTVTAGNLATTDGDNSAAYNLTSGTGVSFGGENGSDGGATVTALDGNGANGDAVHVTGFATVTSNNGNAQITGLDAVGEKAVIKDNTGSADNDTITYEVVCDAVAAPAIGKTVVRRTDGSGNTSYYEATAETVFTDSYGGTTFTAVPINTSDYSAEIDFLYNGIPVAKGTEHKDVAATLTNDGGKTLQVNSDVEMGVNAKGDTVNIKDAGTQTAYTLDENSHITAAKASYTTTTGVVSDADGTLTLTTKDDSLTAKGKAKVDASVLSYDGATGTITYKAGTAIEATEVILGKDGRNISITEEDNKTATVYDGS